MGDLIIALRDGVRTITFNRPRARNAITKSMYIQLTNVLNADAVDDSVVVTILTGSGDFYSSGNDFKDAMNTSSDPSSTDTMDDVADLVNALINYPKLLVAVVNGPAIGVAATTAALCDIVYAADTAWFHTPFMQLALCPEGCSSYTYPRLLGRSLASEMLFLNRKLTAQEALARGFVSKVVPFGKVAGMIEELRQFGKLPVESVKVAKTLVTANLRETLSEANKRETLEVKRAIASEGFLEAVLQVLSKKKSKL